VGLYVPLLEFNQDGTDKPVMEIKDLIGQRRTCFEQDRDQCSITAMRAIETRPPFAAAYAA